MWSSANNLKSNNTSTKPPVKLFGKFDEKKLTSDVEHLEFMMIRDFNNSGNFLKEFIENGNFVKLHTLKFQMCRLDENTFSTIFTNIQHHLPELTSLSFDNIDFNDTEAKILLELIQQNAFPKLVSISLKEHTLSKEMAFRLISTIKSDENLKLANLDITSNTRNLELSNDDISYVLDIKDCTVHINNPVIHAINELHRMTSQEHILKMQTLNPHIGSVEKIKHNIIVSKLLDNAQKGQNDIVKYIITHPEKYGYFNNLKNFQGHNLIHYYKDNTSFKEFLFTHGIIPDPLGFDNELLEIYNDNQRAHNKTSEQERDFVLNEVRKHVASSNNGIPTLSDTQVHETADILGQEINAIMQDTKAWSIHVLLSNTSPSVRAEFFAEAISRSQENANIAYYNKLIGNTTTQDNDANNQQEAEQYIRYILEKGANALESIYTQKNEQGEYIGRAAEIVKYKISDDNTETITIPEFFAIIKKYYVDGKSPSIADKHELLVTLLNKTSATLLDNSLSELTDNNENLDLTKLSNRTEAYKFVSTLSESDIDNMFFTIAHQPIEKMYMFKNLQKIAEASCHSAITYGGDGGLGACREGVIGKTSEILEYEIAQDLATKYMNSVEEQAKIREQEENMGKITPHTVNGIVSTIALKMINEMEHNHELQNKLLEFMSSSKLDPNNISEEFVNFIPLINKTYLEAYHRIPSFNEYVELLDSVSANGNLQSYCMAHNNVATIDNSETTLGGDHSNIFDNDTFQL